MHTKFLAASLCGLFAAVRSAPSPQSSVGFTSANAPNPFLQCASVHLGCKMDLKVMELVPFHYRWVCDCDDNPENKADLAWFYTEKNFLGYEYRSYGDYGTCYNLPEAYDKKAKSFASNEPGQTPIICCIYTDWFCNENGHAFTEVTDNEGSIAELQGFYAHGVSSFRCARWIDEASNCKGTGPGQ